MFIVSSGKSLVAFNVHFASNHRRFTLLEFVIVVTVSAIMVLITLPNIDATQMRVERAGSQVDIALLSAQRLAVLRQHGVVVAFDTLHDRLRVHQDRNNNGRMDVGEAVEYVDLGDDVRFGRGSSAPALPAIGRPGITFAKRQAGLPAVTFSPEGTAGETGGFYIASSRALANYAFSTETRAFEINRRTRRTSMYSFSGIEWRRQVTRAGP